jgi:glutathione S-transferase
MKSPEYLGINPIGKAPCLHLVDGTTVPESSTIIEYLEDDRIRLAAA